MGIKWYLTVVLMCVSPTANDVEHLFTRLLAICKCFNVFPIFFFFLELSTQVLGPCLNCMDVLLFLSCLILAF